MRRELYAALQTYQSTNLFPQPTPNCGSSCEKVTGNNVINVLKGGSVVLCPPGAKAFLLVTDNKSSRLDSPFCVITKAIYHIFEAYSLYFYISLISFLNFFLLFFKICRLFFIYLSPHYSLISIFFFFAYYSLISIKNGHYSLISKPHPDPHSCVAISWQIYATIHYVIERWNLILYMSWYS